MLKKFIKCLLCSLLVGSSMIFVSSNCFASEMSKADEKVAAPPSAIHDATPIEPTKVFDNLYYLGTNGVGAWLIETSDGLILIDAMNNSDDAKDIIVGGMEKLGFNPYDIKYVVVTHGHGDHYGGAQYIQENYGAEILMSTIDWDYMNATSGGANDSRFPKPTSYTPVTDGEKLALGNTTITIVSTPGHTPGGISLIIPVTDNGTEHMVGMWGGTGLPSSLEDNKKYLSSLEHFAKFTDGAKVDAEITAHPFVDNSIERMEILRNRVYGDANPYVIGEEAYKAYMDNTKTSVLDNIKKLEQQN
ncbi:MBL fold metallo-hydrolase [Clostridium sp. SHJSY1]|uniref:MBL fold metallo-hydrolase n=1 Tax=Clostridium sp. SHJSY1 TaxID=2942483 RepID=UPI00287701F7|nr:MBL fold metallo-hydrolase [Clostridium sp. SHJSY1]MDS0527075.1 MBL fold metallo-hydrolase [Clostridium sp. SHJSY1]